MVTLQKPKPKKKVWKMISESFSLGSMFQRSFSPETVQPAAVDAQKMSGLAMPSTDIGGVGC